MPTPTRLFGLTVDEISGVDRDANGHATVLIAKRDNREDEPMALFDAATGQPIAEDDLQVGDHVVDDSGREFYLMDDELLDSLTDEQIDELGLDIPDDAAGLEQYDDEFDDADDSRLVGVGKAMGAPAITGGLRTIRQAGRGIATRGLEQPRAGAAGMFGHDMPNGLGGRRAFKAGRAARRHPRVAIAGGAGAGGAGAAAYGRSRTSKRSTGDFVLEQLSKAFNDDERNDIISKALNDAEARTTRAEQAAMQATRVAKALEDQQILTQYIELADEYDLPVDSAEFGEILRTIGESGLSKRQLDVLDSVFSQAAAATELYSEVGVVGGGARNSVMDMVNGAAREHVGKADVTMEQTTAALFEAHPELYDEYMAEQRNQ